MLNTYNAEIVAGALLPTESRIIARLILDDVTDLEFQRLVIVENVLQKRSPSTAKRKAELIQKRFKLVRRELVELIAHGSRQASVQALLVGAIKHSRLIGDFLLRVVREKMRVFETELKTVDWETFLLECEQIDPSIKKWKQSTRVKLGQVVKKCLVEADYLRGSRKFTITPVFLAPEVKKYLVDNDEEYVLTCMDLVS